MNVTICWAEASSYAGACFRSLAAKLDLNLHVVHLELGAQSPPWQGELFQGVSNKLFRVRDQPSDAVIRDAIAATSPDVVVVCGWFFRPYVRAVLHPQLRRARVVVGMDTPWRNTLAQRLNRVRLRSFVHRASRFVVAGERSRDYARRLGVPEASIDSGYYGFDFAAFAGHANARRQSAGGWPRSFLFVGRYIKEKGLDMLVDAYRIYRERVHDPWSLACTGSGTLDEWLSNQQGVVNLGYTQPGDLPKLLSRHGALVLPSNYEPWGVVIAEAAASGMPVLCTTACGAGLDIVRPYYNGLVVPPGDPTSLASGMVWCHQHESELDHMGQRGSQLAEAFSADAWATRWYNYLCKTMSQAS